MLVTVCVRTFMSVFGAQHCPKVNLRKLQLSVVLTNYFIAYHFQLDTEINLIESEIETYCYS